MDFGLNQYMEIIDKFGGPAASFIKSFVILFVGWMLAKIVRATVKGILNRTSLDNKLADAISNKEEPVHIETWISGTVFWIIMSFVFLAFFESINLKIVTDPLNTLIQQMFGYVPNILSAIVLMAVSLGIATLVKFTVARLLRKTKLDEGIAKLTGDEALSNTPEQTGEALYWLVLLIFFPGILSTLGLTGLLEPIQGMTSKVVGFIPNIFAAMLTGVLGLFAARALRKIITNLAKSTSLDKSDKFNAILGENKPSELLGRIVHAFVMVFVTISALDALKIEAISVPATKMLTLIFETLPNLVTAILIIFVAYHVGRVIQNTVVTLISKMGFNSILKGLRFGKSAEGDGPSSIVGKFVFISIMVFASIEASDTVGLTQISKILTDFIVFGGQLVSGLVILGIGTWVANTASDIAENWGGTTTIISKFVYGIVMVLVGAMTLRQIGLAEDIINLAFGFTLGSIAIGLAIAIGWGGKDIAQKEIEKLVANLRK